MIDFDLRQSTLTLFQTCPRRFKLWHDDGFPQQEPSENMRIGTAVHSAIANTLAGIYVDALDDVSEKIFNHWVENVLPLIDLDGEYFVELPFRGTIRGVPIASGGIDFISGNNVIDWKTSPSKGAASERAFVTNQNGDIVYGPWLNQMYMYSSFIITTKSPHCTELFWTFYIIGRASSSSVVHIVTKDEVDWWCDNVLVPSARQMNDGPYPAIQGKHCLWCNYSEVCKW